MKIVCASSLTLGREIFSAMGDVVLVPEKDITAAVVKDAGLPADISPAKSAGIGLELVETLTRQIRGQREFNTGPEGTTVVIRWPAQPPQAPESAPPLTHLSH